MQTKFTARAILNSYLQFTSLTQNTLANGQQ